jgi:GntR family transcriptional regulator
VVRQALDGLERIGAIYRVKGKGAFRAERKARVYLLQNPEGFYASMIEQGLALETHVLGRSVIAAPAWVAEALAVEVEAAVMALERLRLLEGEPVFLGTSYVPQDLAGACTDEELAESLNVALARRWGLQPTRGRRIIETAGAGPYEAGMLEVPVGMPLFRLLATTYAQDGRPMEHTAAWLRGDRLAFEVNLR